MKVTAETITDAQVRDLYIGKHIDERMYEIAIGATISSPIGSDLDDDGSILEPEEWEIERVRKFCAAHWNARHGGEP